MEICDNIYYSIENKSFKKNDIVCRQVFRDFCRKSKETFSFADESASYINKLRYLLYEYVYQSDEVDIFFDILNSYGYYKRQEIKDAMHHLGLLKNPNENSEIIKKYLNSPYIQDISFDGVSKFIIESDRFGRFSFDLASYVYRDNESIKNYIETKELPNDCHNHTYYLSQRLPECYSITALCKSYFFGNYFHSFTYDKERDVIIDLCSNAVVNRDSYYSLFTPRDVSVVLNEEVREELNVTNHNCRQPYDRCYILKIALYKLYLESIGYTGDYYEGPKSYILKK